MTAERPTVPAVGRSDGCRVGGVGRLPETPRPAAVTSRASSHAATRVAHPALAMTTFLTTHGTAYHLERVLTEAAAEVVLVSPFLQLSPTLAQRLQDAGRRGVAITLVYGKSELKPDQQALLAGVERLALYYLENLHAKCYYNERAMVLTSMNMYAFSEKANREMGVLLGADEPAYADAVREVASILAAARRGTLPPARAARVGAGGAPAVPVSRAWARGAGGRGAGAWEAPRGADTRGYCVRCRRGVLLDPEQPFCVDCYRVWTEYGNADYPERWCHACGGEHATSMARPRCRACWAETASR